MSSILAKILRNKRDELETMRFRKQQVGAVRANRDSESPNNVLKALTKKTGITIIAEIKRASPSMGPIRQDVDAAAQARQYAAGGADIISVLTEGRFFAGSMSDLAAVKNAVRLPVLCKDFILDPMQITRARFAGADAILLIAAILDRHILKTLYHEVQAQGLTPLIEIHELSELDRVMELEPGVIGINNRDLKTMTVDLHRAVHLRKYIPEHISVVSESGIRSPADIEKLVAGGIRAFLVGSALMKSKKPQYLIESYRTAGNRVRFR